MPTTAFQFPASEAGRLLHVAQLMSRAPDLPSETQQIYRVWILGYLRYLEQNDLGDPKPDYVPQFLDRLSRTDQVSEERRQQAAKALVFFHEEILDQEVSDVNSRMEMLSTGERRNLLVMLDGAERLLARVIFTTDLSLAQALRLRVGDVDVRKQQLMITNERGCTEGFSDISEHLAQDLQQHLSSVREQYDQDREDGHGAVDLPSGVHEQFPNAHVSWVWQYVFPSDERSVELYSGLKCRHPMQPSKLLEMLRLRTSSGERADASASPSEGASSPAGDSLPAPSKPAASTPSAGAGASRPRASTGMSWNSIYSIE